MTGKHRFADLSMRFYDFSLRHIVLWDGRRRGFIRFVNTPSRYPGYREEWVG